MAYYAQQVAMHLPLNHTSMRDKINIQLVNTQAMQNGIVLGIFGILSLYVFKQSFTLPFCSTLFGIMLLGSPVLATFLTLKFRNQYFDRNMPFSFTNGFLHTFFMGIYASIWVAVATFVYLQYFDHGTIFAAYEQSLNTPEMKLYLQQTGINEQIKEISGSEGAHGMAQVMASLGSATYAAMSIYCSLFVGPILSIIIGLITRRN